MSHCAPQSSRMDAAIPGPWLDRPDRCRRPWRALHGAPAEGALSAPARRIGPLGAVRAGRSNGVCLADPAATMERASRHKPGATDGLHRPLSYRNVRRERENHKSVALCEKGRRGFNAASGGARGETRPLQRGLPRAARLVHTPYHSSDDRSSPLMAHTVFRVPPLRQASRRRRYRRRSRHWRPAGLHDPSTVIVKRNTTLRHGRRPAMRLRRRLVVGRAASSCRRYRAASWPGLPRAATKSGRRT